MKKILITPRIEKVKEYYEIRECLDISWSTLLRKMDLLPIILPLNAKIEDYFDNFDISGVILTGGNDLTLFNDNELSKIRDKQEIELLEKALKKNIPIWGICRGMQLIVNYFGGEFCRVKNHVAKRHDLFYEKNIDFDIELLPQNVNSFHQWAIRKINQELKILACSEEGFIEAAFNKEKKIFTQMWHPEREIPFIENELLFIKKMFQW